MVSCARSRKWSTSSVGWPFGIFSETSCIEETGVYGGGSSGWIREGEWRGEGGGE